MDIAYIVIVILRIGLMGQRQGSFLRNRPLLDDGVLVVAVLVVVVLMIMFMMLVKVTTHFG